MRRGEIPSGRSIASAVTDARLVQLEQELAALRETAGRSKAVRVRRRRAVSDLKVFISKMKARGLSAVQICRALDAAERKELEPLPSWIKATGLRLWRELWSCSDSKIRNRVRTYIHSVAPFDPKGRH